MSSPMHEMPEHLAIPVYRDSEGPATEEDIDYYVCWSCGTPWPCEGAQNE